MNKLSKIVCAVLAFATLVTSLSVPRATHETTNVSTMNRRAAFGRVAASAPLLFIASLPSVAYERRDVGGDNPSPETAAMNIQAYETQNRLEREGFKLETQAEQKASLTAALQEYSYEPSVPSNKADNTSKKGGTSSAKKTK